MILSRQWKNSFLAPVSDNSAKNELYFLLFTMADLSCDYCNTRPGEFVCDGCGSTLYCSKECQTADWNDGHRELCNAIRGVTSTAIKPIQGRVDMKDFQRYSDVDLVRTKVNEILESRRAGRTVQDKNTMWVKEGSVVYIMQAALLLYSIDDPKTIEKLRQMFRLALKPAKVRKLFVYGVLPEEIKRQAADVMLRMTRVFLDPLPIEYGNPTDRTPLFPRSKRPENYMFLADEFIQTGVSILPDQWSMKVVRFMKSLDRGTFFKEDVNLARGRFFFYDPDAKTVIHAPRDRVLIAANKAHAFITLAELYKKAWPARPSAWDEKWGGLDKTPRQIFGQLSDLFFDQDMHSVSSAINHALRVGANPSREFPPPWRGVIDTPTSPNSIFTYGASLGLGMEVRDYDHTYRYRGRDATRLKYHSYVGNRFTGHYDELDPIIHELGRMFLYDIIVLQSEPGRRRCVTEVYCLREGTTPFTMIVRDMALAPDTVMDPEQPCLWYPGAAKP